MTFRESFLAVALTALTCAIAVLLAAPPTYFTTSAAPNGTPSPADPRPPVAPGSASTDRTPTNPGDPHTNPGHDGPPTGLSPNGMSTDSSPNGISTGPSPNRASGLRSPGLRSPGFPPPGLPPPDLPSARPTRFGWPLAPPHPVVRPFQPPSTPYGPGHRGVDLGGQPNARVLAAGDGVVVFAGPLAGRGVVSIDHAGGIRTTYEPLAVLIPAGTRATRGTVIGHLTPGHPGCVDAPACLHWGVRRGTEYLDPLGLLSTGRVRLLPWPDGGDPTGGR